MNVYLGLGSNIPDRKKNLIKALQLLSKHVRIIKISPVYETPALLPEHSLPSWNRPFLNLVLKAHVTSDISKLLCGIQDIEEKIGREKDRKKWSPRKIDIDILSSDKIINEIKELTVPHPFLLERDFCLSPFSDIASHFVEPVIKKNILSLRRELKNKIPSFMDIFNFTPDSFSDDGADFPDLSSYSETADKEKLSHFYLRVSEKIKRNLDHCVQWMDIGGCSTRPGADNISVEQEWIRIRPFFDILKNFPDHLMKISVDTFRSEIAEKALSLGVDAINDVSGLSDSRMISVLKDSSCDYILMHSLTIPADKKKTIDVDKDPVQEIKVWLDEKLNQLQKNHIHLDRIIFDPGIGFGKTACQSLKIIQNIHEFLDYPVRVMVGHSRKSFMSIFTDKKPSDRSCESIGLSIQLAQKGVDILRVHEASEHARAWLAYKHGVIQEESF